MKQSPNLDLLRATAVLLVFVSHLPYAIAPGHGASWDLDFLGHFGVTMFFIHTSLVLCGSLSRIETQNCRVVGSFYVRRAFRIYPLSIVAVLLAFGLRIPPWFHTPFRSPGALYFWSNLLLFQNLARQLPAIGPLWSLPYEVQMYLLLPFVYFWGKKLRRPMLLGFSGLAVYLLDRLLSRQLGYPPLFEYAPWFFLGVALHFATRKPSLSPRLYGATLVLLITAALIWHETLFDFYLAAVPFAFLFPKFRELRSRRIRGVAAWIARYSYGIYLAHVPILEFVTEGMANQPMSLRVLTFLLLTAIVPVILFHAIEKPFIAVGVRLSSRRAFGTHHEARVPQALAS